MKRTQALIGVAIAGWIGMSPLRAEADRYAHEEDSYFVRAEVVDVQPLWRTVQVSEPRRVCRKEPVRHVHHGRGGNRTHTPAILGGIIGGVVGNQIGKGRGRNLATAAGVVLGASIGSDYARNQRQPGRTHSYVTTEHHCAVEETVHQEERIEGYRVTYRYHGRQFVTQTDHHPGRTVRVRVRVEPLAYTGGARPF